MSQLHPIKHASWHVPKLASCFIFKSLFLHLSRLKIWYQTVLSLFFSISPRYDLTIWRLPQIYSLVNKHYLSMLSNNFVNKTLPAYSGSILPGLWWMSTLAKSCFTSPCWSRCDSLHQPSSPQSQTHLAAPFQEQPPGLSFPCKGNLKKDGRLTCIPEWSHCVDPWRICTTGNTKTSLCSGNKPGAGGRCL